MKTTNKKQIKYVHQPDTTVDKFVYTPYTEYAQNIPHYFNDFKMQMLQITFINQTYVIFTKFIYFADTIQNYGTFSSLDWLERQQR